MRRKTNRAVRSGVPPLPSADHERSATFLTEIVMGAIRNMNWTLFTPALTVYGSFTPRSFAMGVRNRFFDCKNVRSLA